MRRVYEQKLRDFYSANPELRPVKAEKLKKATMQANLLQQQQQQHQQQQQQQQQVNQTVISRPPLQRPRSKAIPIVDPTTQCEIDISAAKTPAPSEPATKASTPLLTQPEESASEVRLIELWNFKSCLVFDFFKEANYFNTIVISS